MNSMLNSLTTWRRSEVVERVQGWQSRGLKMVDVPVLISCLDGLPIDEIPLLLGDDDARHTIAAYLLSHDPSFQRREIPVVEMWNERPFPRYLIALLFLAMMESPALGWRFVAEELWRNLTTTAQPFSPELLRELLQEVFSTRELLKRTIGLVISGDSTREFIGNNLFYSMRFPKADLREVAKGFLENAAESDQVQRLRTVLNKYS